MTRAQPATENRHHPAAEPIEAGKWSHRRQEREATDAAELEADILELIPPLRAFARSLTGTASDADDLVQETLTRAVSNIHQFTPHTNLKAWLFRIQRNAFYSLYRKRQRETALLPEQVDRLVAPQQQEWPLKLQAMDSALNSLPADQKQALLLVSAAGLSYEEAADLCGCPLGTIKSRVCRARSSLLQLLNVEEGQEFLKLDRPKL